MLPSTRATFERTLQEKIKRYSEKDRGKERTFSEQEGARLVDAASPVLRSVVIVAEHRAEAG
jgi:hypothetical protein